jgi:hypothetical protein
MWKVLSIAVIAILRSVADDMNAAGAGRTRRWPSLGTPRRRSGRRPCGRRRRWPSLKQITCAWQSWPPKIALAQQSEDPMDLRNALTVRGFVAMCQGRYTEALEPHSECVAICRGLRAAERSAVDRAATLAGNVAAIRDTIASHAAPFDVAITGPRLDRIKASVSEERWHRAWDRGAALDSAAVVAYALAN